MYMQTADDRGVKACSLIIRRLSLDPTPVFRSSLLTVNRMKRALTLLAFAANAATAQDPRLAALKAEAQREIESQAKQIQVMVDQVFSYGELGFQEFETSKYLSGILEKNGFQVERGYAGIPTAFVARWGSGRPVITLGSDIDDIPQASNKPGVGYFDPIIAGAPGHGEGHNSGLPVQIAAALAVKKIMAREKIPGTLVLWPGVAEEQLGTKAHYVRAGLFKDVDVTLFAHVGDGFDINWGDEASLYLISARFSFRGASSHAAGQPWRGKSALDAVMLMAMSWEFQREHIELAQRSHYVIPDGGDQPNVVPPTASIWYFFRNTTYERTLEMFEDAKAKARAAAQQTGTQLESVQILGSAWRPHMNRPVAEAMHANARAVGMPAWSADDQRLARAVQREVGSPEAGLAADVRALRSPGESRGGTGSDDIGDVSWSVPMVTLRFPSNIPGLPGHNWVNSIAMATPIAHKGAVAGAKVAAMTLLDILLTPKLVADAWTYFNTVQTATIKYKSFLGPDDKPAIWLNADKMARFRDEMRKFYYDPAKYGTYLEQLGIRYPTVKGVIP
jgi:aminobenzoyl-glutamate utilization protein B